MIIKGIIDLQQNIIILLENKVNKQVKNLYSNNKIDTKCYFINIVYCTH